VRNQYSKKPSSEKDSQINENFGNNNIDNVDARYIEVDLTEDLKQILDSSKGEKEELKKEREELKSERILLKKEREESMKENKELKKENEELKKEIHELKKEINELKKSEEYSFWQFWPFS
jgi:predicted  nucleic acid-binding Zn-ribbon protein